MKHVDAQYGVLARPAIVAELLPVAVLSKASPVIPELFSLRAPVFFPFLSP